MNELRELALERTCKEFILKVESGKAKSTDTYNKMKQALSIPSKKENLTEYQEILFGAVLDILKERHNQDDKWGIQNHDPILWLSILGEEVGEANKAAISNFFDGISLDDSKNSYREELIQVAAVAMAAVECLDRNSK